MIKFYAKSLEEKAGNVYISSVSVNFLTVRLPPWKPGAHYRVHRSKPLSSIASQMSPIGAAHASSLLALYRCEYLVFKLRRKLHSAFDCLNVYEIE